MMRMVTAQMIMLLADLWPVPRHQAHSTTEHEPLRSILHIQIEFVLSRMAVVHITSDSYHHRQLANQLP